MRNIPYYQKTALISCCAIAFGLTASSVVLAETTADERAKLVDKELSCISKVKSRQGAFTWNDVCYLEEEPEASANPKSVSVTLDAEGGVTLEKKGVQKAVVPPKKAVAQPAQAEEGSSVLTAEDFDMEEDPAMELDKSAWNDNESVPVSVIERDRKKLVVELGSENFYYDFDSEGGNSRVGSLFGLFGALTYHLGPEEDLSKYDSITVVKLDTHLAQDVDAFMADVRGLAGVDFISGNNTRVTPYLGIGYRYLRDKDAGETQAVQEMYGNSYYYTNGTRGVKEELKYIYIPLGVELHRPLHNRWAVQLNAEFDFLLQGRSTRHYEDLGELLVDTGGDTHVPNAMEFTHDKGYGWRASVKFLHSASEMDFFVEPFIRFWKIDESDIEQFRSDGTGAIWYYTGTDEAVIDQVAGHEITEYGLKAGVLY